MPVTPWPAASSTSDGAGSAPPRSAAARATTRASGWLDACSSAPARRSASPSGMPFTVTSRSSAGLPTDSVPVLSNTTAVTAPSCSSAAPVRTMICRRAARLIPATIATGGARMSGQGVATTSTASTRVQSWLTRNAATHASAVRGVNHTAYRSASRWSGAFVDCALRTSSTMRAYWLVRAGDVARMVNEPAPFNEPLIRRTPGIGGDRRRLAGERRRIHVGGAGDDDAVAGHEIAGPKQQHVVHAPRRRRRSPPRDRHARDAHGAARPLRARARRRTRAPRRSARAPRPPPA